MRIQRISIKHYKAFYGQTDFAVEGKNLFIYGENGSGKSSFYYALKDFFQSSLEEDLDFSETENVFLPEGERGQGRVEVQFRPNKDGQDQAQAYIYASSERNTYSAGDTSIRDAIKLKSFLTYKHLLGIHHLKKDDEIDLFELLVKGVLKHFRSVALTGDRELGQLWAELETIVARPRSAAYRLDRKKAELDAAMERFNQAFSQLFEVDGLENILRYAQPILDRFGHGIRLDLRYIPTRANESYEALERHRVSVKVWYQGHWVQKPQVFLNEARLSAIAIAIYLGMVKRHVQGIPCKILFLDDIFIGLDMANRLPLLEILQSDFADYQVFMTTYDKPWYEFVRTVYLNNKPNWKCFELYAGRSSAGFSLPVLKEVRGLGNNAHLGHFIQVAEQYQAAADHKAAGVYLRSAFEAILKQFCFGKVTVKFMPDASKLTANDFWTATKKYLRDNPSAGSLSAGLQAEIDHLISLVLNPLAHNDTHRQEHSTEINRAVQALKDLRQALGV